MARPLTIRSLVRASGISRTTLLYYESLGLLRPAGRSPAGYRLYGSAELDRVRRIRALRASGLTLQDIGELLRDEGGSAAAVLKRRLEAISRQVDTLREHRLAILRLLGSIEDQQGAHAMTKQRWIEIMDAAGFSHEDKRRWHQVFEAQDPNEHELFLRYLQIPPDEIRRIRESSRDGG